MKSPLTTTLRKQTPINKKAIPYMTTNKLNFTYMKQRYLFIVAFFLTVICSFSQEKKSVTNGYTLTIDTKNLQNEKLILFLKYGTNSQMIISDSITIKSINQRIVFKKDTKVIDAIYFLKLASQKEEVQIVMDNNSTLNLSLQSKNIESITCQQIIVKDFLEYQMKSKLATSNDKIDFRNKLIQKYPKSVLGLYMTIENKISEPFPTKIEDKFLYGNNFFNSFNKNDKRIYLLPNIYRLLYHYINILPINNANYQENIRLVMKDIDCKSRNYPVYLKWFISNLNYFETKNLESTYLFLYENYIQNDTCKTFTDSESSTNNHRYNTIKKIPNYSIIPDVKLVTKDSVEYSISDIYKKSDYTFIAFYSPTCHHCEKTMPLASATFENLKNKYPTKKIELIAIINDRDEEKWEQFISERKISKWYNLKSIDPDRKYQSDFNAYSNPNFFLIDKKGTVLLKSYNPPAIEEIINK